MSLDPHLRWKGEEEGNPGLVARNTEWFFSSRGVRAPAGVEVTIIVSQPMQRYMARRTSNKIEPATMTIVTTSPNVGVGATASFTADLSQMACLLNRRFYRQGLNWAVAGFKVFTGDGVQGMVSIRKLPNTWVMSNAWEKGMRAWLRMNREALEDSPSVRPRFLDFKIYADETHHTAGFDGNLLPLDSQLPLSQAYVAGEWEASKIVQPKTDGTDDVQERELLAVGPNYPGVSPVSGFNAVSLIEGYAASRGLPNVLDPNVPADAASADGNIPANWIASMFNQGTEQTETVIEDMISENNIAPYPFENDGVHTDTMYPGGANQAPSLQRHDFVGISGTTIGGISRLKGGNFPCGLVRFDFANTGTSGGTLTIQIDLVPGNHRGYLAEPMTEM